MTQDPGCRQTVTVKLPDGLHLRPISRIVETVRRSQCQLRIFKETASVDAANVLDLMTLNAQFGAVLTLEAEGEGAAELIAQIVRLFESNFNEDQES